jgi:hypothetical protein
MFTMMDSKDVHSLNMHENGTDHPMVEDVQTSNFEILYNL